MPLTNETVASLPTKLLFHQDTRILCYMNRNVWLLNLTVAITTIQYHVMAILVVLFLLYLLRFRRHRRFVDDLTEDELAATYDPEYRSLFYATYCILEKEIILVTVYVLSAVMYKWLVLMNKDNNITSLNIYQWFIEATWAPVVIGVTYVVTPDIHLNNMENRFAGFYRMAVAIKIPTFIVIRYAETNTGSVLNDLIASLFRITCR